MNRGSLGSLVSEATALPTEPQLLPTAKHSLSPKSSCSTTNIAPGSLAQADIFLSSLLSLVSGFSLSRLGFPSLHQYCFTLSTKNVAFCLFVLLFCLRVQSYATRIFSLGTLETFSLLRRHCLASALVAKCFLAVCQI